MKSHFGRILATIVLAGTFSLAATSAWAAATAADLDGTYRFMTNGSEFWKETVGGVKIYDNLYADVGTITFDGSGNCSLTFDELNYAVELGGDDDQVTVEQEANGPDLCTYTVSPAGQVTLVFVDDEERFWASEDGNLLVQGGGGQELEADGVEYFADLTVAVKAGSGLSKSSLNGTYKAVSLDADFDKFGNLGKHLYANNVTLTFNGNGSGTFVVSNGKDFDVNLSAPITVSTDSGGENGTFSYTVSPDGLVTLSFTDDDEQPVLWLSADGNVLLGASAGEFPDDEEINYAVNQFVAVKSGAGLSKSSLKGNYNVAWLERGFEKDGATVFNEIQAGPTTINFDGNGKCTLTFDEEDFEVNLASPSTVLADPDSGTENCTYTVSSDGVVSLKFADGSKDTAWLSANGSTLLAGGASVDGVDYATSLLVGIKTDVPPPPPAPYVVAAKANAGGTIDPAGTVNIPAGESRTFVITPNQGFHIVSVTVDGQVLVSDNAKFAPYQWTSPYSVTVPDALNPDATKHTIAVKFAANSYTVEAIQPVAGGKITPVGTKYYKHGKKAMYTITANKGQVIASVLVNGVPQDLTGKDLTKPFKLPLVIAGPLTITATFQ